MINEKTKTEVINCPGHPDKNPAEDKRKLLKLPAIAFG